MRPSAEAAAKAAAQRRWRNLRLQRGDGDERAARAGESGPQRRRLGRRRRHGVRVRVGGGGGGATLSRLVPAHFQVTPQVDLCRKALLHNAAQSGSRPGPRQT
jgi:hypothetical protein